MRTRLTRHRAAFISLTIFFTVFATSLQAAAASPSGDPPLFKGYEAGELGQAMNPDTLSKNNFPSRAPFGQQRSEAEEDSRIPGRYIVVFKDSVKGPATVARNQVEQRGGELGLVYRHALKGYSAALSKGAVQALRNDPRVRYVQPDHKVEALAQTTPTGVERVFATENAAIDIDEEDDIRVDADVAVLDTGVDHEHPDLNVVGRVNCVPIGESTSEETEGCVPGAGTDGRGHGTHVAGTIAALDNGEGVVGVAPGARISAVRVLNKAGSGAMSWIIAGVDWVTVTREDESSANDIDVANMSLGCACSSKALDDAISGYEEGEEHIPGSVDMGVVYVVAAGNSAANADEFSPASNPDVITVSALADTDGASGGSGSEECIDDAPDPDVTRKYTDDALAYFSNWGAAVDIAASGGCILSTYPGDEYKTSSGTSMASPHVAGAAAVLTSEGSSDSKEDVEVIREDLVEAASLDLRHILPGPPAPLLYLGDEPLTATEVATGGTQSLTAMSAELTGALLPRGPKTEYKFEYGTSAEYGQEVPVTPEEIDPGAPFTRVSESIEDLSPATTYHYRLVATNESGTFEGADETFTTPGLLFSLPATDVTESAATLQGALYLPSLPEGVSATYHFEYGLTTDYGHSVAGEVAEKDEKTESLFKNYEHVVAELDELKAGSTYHYRLVATTSQGVFYGKDQRLRTTKWQASAEAAEAFPGPLQSVSCLSSDACMAVGGYPGFWDGSKWDIHSLESGKILIDVTCTSKTSCMAVGWEGLFPTPVAMLWDGESWVETPTPTPPKAEMSSLGSISCSSSNSCVAIGGYTYFSGAAIQFEYLAMQWDGEDWQELSMPKGTNGIISGLADVSCVSGSFCAAVGTSTMHWDGEEWSPMPMSSGGYEAVSCFSTIDCIAVGFGAGNPEEGTAARWDGSKWSSMPAGRVGVIGGWAMLSDLSCSSPSSCVAVGTSQNGEYDYPLAMRWDGTQWSTEMNSAGLVAASYRRPYGVSCPTAGHCVAVGASWEAGEDAEVLTYDYPVSPPTASIGNATGIGTTAATLTGTVGGGSLPTNYYFEYDTVKYKPGEEPHGVKTPVPPKYLGSTSAGVGVSAQIKGLEPETTYFVRLVATNENDTTYSPNQEFTTQPTKPSVATQPVGWTGMGGAGLRGKVNPNAVATVFQFEYGKTTSYGSKAPASPKAIGSGTTEIEVQQGIASLEPNTTYHYRVVATNAKGTSYGQDREFTTLPPAKPAIDTPFASILASNAASLKAMVNPNGASTTYQFEYGKTTSYGSKAPASPQAIGSGVADAEAKESIEGLQAGETYHFRVVATNEKGTTYGQDKTFTVSSIPKLTSGTELKPEEALPNPFYPTGVAVDPEDNVWISDDYMMRAQKFDSEGEYLMTVGSEEGDNTELTRGIATDPEGNVLIGQPDLGVVQKFDAEGEHLVEIGEGYGQGNGELHGVQGIATDSQGDIWVTDADNHRVQEFGPEGEYLSQIDTGLLNGRVYDVAVDPQGDIWVRTGSESVQEFDEEGELLNQIDVGGWGLALDVDSAGVIWVTVGCKVLAFGTEGEQLLEHGSCGGGALDKFGDWLGLTVDESGNVWVADAPNRRVVKWARAFPPSATTQAAIEVGAQRAILKGLVNPNGASTTYQFEYGKTTSYGSKAPASPKAIGSGTSSVEVGKLIQGLEPGTTYHYRVAAVNAAGTHYGQDKTLTTPAEEAGVWLAGEGSEVEAEQPRFETEDYSLKYFTGSSELTIDLGGLDCSNASFSSQISAPSPLLPFPLWFSSCANTVGATEYKHVSVPASSCEYDLGVQNAGPSYAGSFGVACEEEGDQIVFKTYTDHKYTTVVCEAKVGAQEIGGVDLSNAGEATERKVKLEADVEGIEYEIDGPCVEEPQIRTDGTLTGEMLIEGIEE